MPWVVRDLFNAVGRRMEEYLNLDQIEPTCRYRWPDGTSFDAWQRLPQLIQEIERLSPADVPNFLRFLAYTADIYGAVADNFLLKPFDGISELLTPRLLRDGPKIDSLRSVDAAVRANFASPYLHQIFNRYATYNGSSPYLSPATFNVIAYIEYAEGGWYVRGGMYELARALQHLAEELGVTIRTDTPVAEVLIEHNRACGVRLRSGEVLRANQIITNADPRYAYTHLIPGRVRTAQRLTRLEPSCSGFILFLGINHHYPQLAHHNIFFSSDYPREFQAIFQKGVPAADPTIYVASTCLSDPQHAPPGHMNLFVLVNAPALNQRINWYREAPAYRDLIVAKLERMGLNDLHHHIAYEQIWTPVDLQRHYNAAGGAIYGLASNNRFSAFMRPPLRAPDVRNLYFVGGGTHPGGGIPLVLLSGKAVAERVVLDH